MDCLIKIAGYRFRTLQLPFVLQLDFSGDRRNGGIDVADTRYDRRISGQNRAALGIADNVLQARYRQALAYSGALIDPLVCSCFEGDAFDDLFDETGNDGLVTSLRPGFLFGDFNTELDCCRIVRFDFRTDAILQAG